MSNEAYHHLMKPHVVEALARHGLAMAFKSGPASLKGLVNIRATRMAAYSRKQKQDIDLGPMLMLADFPCLTN